LFALKVFIAQHSFYSGAFQGVGLLGSASRSTNITIVINDTVKGQICSVPDAIQPGNKGWAGEKKSLSITRVNVNRCLKSLILGTKGDSYLALVEPKQISLHWLLITPTTPFQVSSYDFGPGPAPVWGILQTLGETPI